MPPPAGNSIRAQQPRQRQFRVLVPATANPRHHLETFCFGKDIRHKDKALTRITPIAANSNCNSLSPPDGERARVRDFRPQMNTDGHRFRRSAGLRPAATLAFRWRLGVIKVSRVAGCCGSQSRAPVASLCERRQSAVTDRRYKFARLHAVCFRRTNSTNSVTLNMPFSCASPSPPRSGRVRRHPRPSDGRGAGGEGIGRGVEFEFNHGWTRMNRDAKGARPSGRFNSRTMAGIRFKSRVTVLAP